MAICLAAALAPSRAGAQPVPPRPDAIAVQPDTHDFISRADATMNQFGNALRFGGAGLAGFGLRVAPDGTVAVPTEFETSDLLQTFGILGGGMARSASLGISAGCAACLVPRQGGLNPDALRRIDHALKLAHDAGIRLIIPLAGSSTTCRQPIDPVRDTACVFAGWRRLPPTAFFSDAAPRADFAAAITALLNHINGETGVAYRNDSTIAAWENCDDCGAGLDPAMLADWTEFVGRTVKAADQHHLYENGAFAGRITSVSADQLKLPSVDIVGDRIVGNSASGGDRFSVALDAVSAAKRIYLIDAYDWSAATFATPAALEQFFDGLVHNRHLTGAFLSDLSGHAQNGGYLPVPADRPPPLYFPGFAMAGMDADSVMARARAVRRLSYRMLDLVPIAFRTAAPPAIISAIRGQLRWRGSAGARAYSIERSGDITESGSWVTLCDQCATDEHPEWTDPAPSAAPSWYRITPFNANMHAGLPSEPVANKP